MAGAASGAGPGAGRGRLRVVVEADGGSRGNPGPAGYGAVVRDAASGALLAERSASIGTATNNIAEYSGLIAGLGAAADLGAAEVEVKMDSKLVVEQMAGRWKIRHPGLRPLAARAAALASRFDTVRYSWVPRERNRAADALANAAMDAAASGETGGGAAGSPSWAPPETGAPLRLILVRHGETEMTAGRRYSGRGDVPLSARGAGQAAAAGRRIAALAAAASAPGADPARLDAGPPGPVAAVFSSPLARCVATAGAVAEALGPEGGAPPVTVDADLVECDFGVWDGLSFGEVRERYPEEQAAWLASTAVAPPGGESFRAVGDRAARFLERVRAAYPGRLVVAVSHVSPIKMVLKDALAAGDAFLYRCFLSPAGISVIDFYGDGGVAVRTVNDTAHLG